MSNPEKIELSPKEVTELEKNIEASSLSRRDKDFMLKLIKWAIWVDSAIKAKTFSLKRLRQLLFGSRTEKQNKKDKKDDDQKPSTGGSGDKKAKEKESGKTPAKDYSNVKTIEHKHESLKPGEMCPECARGPLYKSRPAFLVTFSGHAPIEATKHEVEMLRCSACGAVFAPAIVKELRANRYDETVGSTLAIFRYAFGMPNKRLETFQRCRGSPLPDSTQWDLLEHAAAPAYPVYKGLIEFAAGGETVYNDDTTSKVLSLMAENKKRKKKKERTGIQTTAMLAQREGKLISLFMTGRRHAGENLQALLSHRPKELPPIITMNDALSRAMPKNLHAIICNCLVHGRRNFKELEDDFAREVSFVIRQLGLVYHNEARIIKLGLDKHQRLAYHQERSARPLIKLYRWCVKMVARKIVEPNSDLGQAMQYMRRHWAKLTRFMSVAGAPLDNNICERLIKTAIRHRKNSLFYKTENGALIGDIFMSLIQTCLNIRVDPFNYLNAIQKYCSKVFACPDRWFPWNYKENFV